MAAVDDMPDILKDTAKTSMSEPLSVSTPGDDSAPAVEGTQLADDTSGAARIYQERRRQVWDEGWTAEHDDAHGRGVLAAAAVCYIQHATGTPYRDNIEAYRSAPPPDGWPWDAVWWKPKQPQRDLVRAGALLAGEIDVIDRDIIRRAAGTE
ncbi:hypothetical protein [Hwanghaeella sp.]|uniref:hypothetical protein n=1 Tax=Hwanghaeella sp. TaxID=2605943 RepID=UPI003CCBEBD1